MDETLRTEANHTSEALTAAQPHQDEQKPLPASVLGLLGGGDQDSRFGQAHWSSSF